MSENRNWVQNLALCELTLRAVGFSVTQNDLAAILGEKAQLRGHAKADQEHEAVPLLFFGCAEGVF